MHNRSIVILLIASALLAGTGLPEARAGFPAPPGLPAPPPPPGLPGSPNVNVRVNGYLPAPPGVHVQIDSGRPYYVEQDRRVYLEKEKPRKHHKKKKKHHEDHGNKYGHDKHGKRDH